MADAVTCFPSAFVYVATMVDEPAPAAVAIPVPAPTVAIAVLLDVHVEELVRFTVDPVPVVPIATNPSVLPMAESVAVDGAIVNDVTSVVVESDGASTVKVDALLTISPL
jgi:hypothetical protein